MDTDKLQEFIMLADEKSFSKCADKLFIAQPVLSKHIKKLESELGVELIKRTTPLELTNAGRYFYAEISKILPKVNSIYQKTREIHNGTKYTLSIGLPRYSKNMFIPLIRRFQRLYNDIDVQVHVYNISELIDALSESRLDLVFMYGINLKGSFQHIDGWDYLPLYEGKMGVVVNKNDYSYHQYKNNDGIDIDVLRDKRFVVIDDEYYRDEFYIFNQLISIQNSKLIKPLYVQSMDDALIAVAMNDCVLLRPVGQTDVNFGEEYVRLSFNNDIEYTRYIAWRKNDYNSAIDRFIQFYPVKNRSASL